MINLFVSLLLTVTISCVSSFPAQFSCEQNEYINQLESFKVKVERQEWDNDLDPSIVKEGVHTIHEQHLVDDDSPTCVQDAATVFDEFAKVVHQVTHPLDAATVKVFGNHDAHCYQSALLILDDVRNADGEKVPLGTIKFYEAKKKDDIIEKCNGARQVALSNLASFETPGNLKDGAVLTYSLIVAINGPDCCESHFPLPLMHGQFKFVVGESMEVVDADKAKEGKDGFLRAKSAQTSENPIKEVKDVVSVERRLCR
jgi:hypothetical protein